MNIKQFLDKYYFHDSLLYGISFDEEKKELIFLIDFCFWAQNHYKKGDTKNGMVEVHFKDVEGYDGKIGEFQYWTILRVFEQDGKIIWCILDDESKVGAYYEWSFSSSDVELVILPPQEAIR